MGPGCFEEIGEVLVATPVTDTHLSGNLSALSKGVRKGIPERAVSSNEGGRLRAVSKNSRYLPTAQTEHSERRLRIGIPR